MYRLVTLVAVFLLAACEGAGAPAARPLAADTGRVPLNQAWWMATHNSYWVDRGYDDPFGSGVGMRFADQFAGFGVRTFEIDIHRSRKTPHEFDVYHTLPGNSVCPTLRDCLREVRALGDALPQHEVVHLVLEYKEIQEPFYDDAHSIGDLDRVLREELGTNLYSPADLLKRCPGASTLRACVAAGGWPSVEYLRGRFIVVMLGNWDELGAASTAAWAQYATNHPAARVAFSMASSWMLDYTKLRPKVTELITEETFAAAIEQSPYLQIEDLSDPRIKPFLASGGIIRAGAVDSLESQEQKLALGIQILQTDLPWVHPNGLDRSRPFTPFDRGERLQEPGFHLEMAVTSTTGAAVRWIDARGMTRVSATLTAGRSGRPVCLVTGTDDSWSGRCRSITLARGTARHATAAFQSIECTGGTCTFAAIADAPAGDRIEIATPDGRFGIASIYAAGDTDPTVLTGLVVEGNTRLFEFEPGVPPLCDSPTRCY